MNGLKPCPFCGGEAHTYKTIAQKYCAICNEPFCANVGPFDTEAEAIATWNTRADYLGFEKAAIEALESIKAWNGRAERTCECIAEYAKSPIDGKTIVLHRCSSCHELMRPHMNYCPNCGAKVVK